MKIHLAIGFVALVVGPVGCSAFDETSPSGSRADRIVLDVRCAADTDCPTGFECEVENEHGVATSYCKSHQSGGSSSDASASTPGSSTCPPGFEQETEHGGTFCKAHGGSSDGSDGGAASTPAAGSVCARDADCSAGLECEIEEEHGVTTSFCKAHGGGKK